jgi:predicted  nucleic acid-binding Zn-ribbon protein
MTGLSGQSRVLEQLLDLHEIDQQIFSMERELERYETELTATEDGVARLASALGALETELGRTRLEARSGERAVDDKRLQLDRLRTRVNQVRNEKQYGAATLELDFARQDIRKLEDHALQKLQVVEDLEVRRAGLLTELEEARARAGPLREEAQARRQQLEEELAIKRDRRYNLAMRIDERVLALYDRIRAGRAGVALAPLTDEAVCGNCYTAVTIQQELQIKELSALVCCEGCGVILYPGDLKR